MPPLAAAAAAVTGGKTSDENRQQHPQQQRAVWAFRATPTNMPCGHGHTEEAVAGSGRLVFLAAELLAMHEICIFYTHNSMRLRVWLQLQFGSGSCQKYFGIECSILFWATTGCVPVCVWLSVTLRQFNWILCCRCCCFLSHHTKQMPAEASCRFLHPPLAAGLG